MARSSMQMLKYAPSFVCHGELPERPTTQSLEEASGAHNKEKPSRFTRRVDYFLYSQFGGKIKVLPVVNFLDVISPDPMAGLPRSPMACQ